MPRVPQQLGTPWSLPATVVLLWTVGRRHKAVAAVVALPLEKAVEVGLKKLIRRRRPVMETPTILRDDAPEEGPSLPSGHAALATATAYFLSRAFPTTLPLLAAGTALASFVRVHQGAHWPSDALAGCALGVTVAATLRRIAVPAS